ncbi:g12752 [Coccomyxa viridis]|uniref:G12752 protein n=1 Tax=Coccomyxa viridis TaxID=1274662 RepID=A0ABP1GB38_9CHLO
MSNPHHKANPADAGWTYQGSNAQSRVDFYEKDGCKMDYYPTTGTVKTSMSHPTQGNTQMFRRDLDDTGFQQVLENPRYHSGQGYQTKNSGYYKGK